MIGSGSRTDGLVWAGRDGPALLATTAMPRSRGIRFELLRRSWPPPRLPAFLPLVAANRRLSWANALTARRGTCRMRSQRAKKRVSIEGTIWNLWLCPMTPRVDLGWSSFAQYTSEMKGLRLWFNDGKRTTKHSTGQQIFPDSNTTFRVVRARRVH